MNNHTTFTGIATITEHAGHPIIIIAGDLAALKDYLGQQDQPGDPEACHASITVGPRVTINLPSMAGLLAAKAFAQKIGTREYGKELSYDEENEAKAAGLVIVFGGSDDRAEFRGAIRDETGIGKINFTSDGEFLSDDRIEELEGLLHDGIIKSLPATNWIHATYGLAGHRYTTPIPHVKFAILEKGELFSEGLVFHTSDINP